MSFFVQHGHGKGDKISTLGLKGVVRGVVLSPGNEDPDTLRATVESVGGFGATPLLDPQSYIYSTNPNGIGSRHADHGLEFEPIHWSQTDAQITSALDRVKAANARVGIVGGPMISPSPIQSLGDIWTPLALRYAQLASAQWGSDRTVATLCLEEGALLHWSMIEDWLDVATRLDVAGFYLLVSRPNGTYPVQPWNAEALSNLLRLVYNLTEINGFEVHWGYSDIAGLLGIGAGATSLASGWHHSLRYFNALKWQPRENTPMRQPTPRLFLGRLWATMKTTDEIVAVQQSSLKDEVIPGPLDILLQNTPVDGWALKDAQLLHLEELGNRANYLSDIGSAPERREVILSSLKSAADFLRQVKDEGISLTPTYTTMVGTYREAFTRFAEAESL